MDLMKRREEILALHKAHEMVPQSPWSPAHPLMKQELDHGVLKISDRPIAFLCDDEVVVLKPDVPKILAGILKFVEEYGPKFDDPAVAASRGHDFNCLKRCRKLLQAAPTGDLSVSQGTWTAYLYGLGEVGVDVVLSDGTFVS